MSPIQPILIVLLIIAAIFGIWSLRMRGVTKAIIGVIATTGTVFILRPELTNSIAHSLGVGRGTDLMFYLFSLATTYAFLIVYARYREVRRDLTTLTRIVAIEHAVQPRVGEGPGSSA
jgi:hypothetical protein